jgi:hypothetical protein
MDVGFISTLQTIYALNILVAGFVGLTALFFPTFSATIVFQNTIPPNYSQRILGCFWIAIALASVLGVFNPLKFSPVLLIQLFYKGFWLIFVALPMLFQGKIADIPRGMTCFFLVWVVTLIFFLPYQYLLGL